MANATEDVVSEGPGDAELGNRDERGDGGLRGEDHGGNRVGGEDHRASEEEGTLNKKRD